MFVVQRCLMVAYAAAICAVITVYFCPSANAEGAWVLWARSSVTQMWKADEYYPNYEMCMRNRKAKMEGFENYPVVVENGRAVVKSRDSVFIGSDDSIFIVGNKRADGSLPILFRLEYKCLPETAGEPE